MNNKIKLEYYNILNSIHTEYLINNIPFNILNHNDIKLTYNNINIKYIKDKNYFVNSDSKPIFNKKKGGYIEPIMVFY